MFKWLNMLDCKLISADLFTNNYLYTIKTMFDFLRNQMMPIWWGKLPRKLCITTYITVKLLNFQKQSETFDWKKLHKVALIGFERFRCLMKILVLAIFKYSLYSDFIHIFSVDEIEFKQTTGING